MKDRTIVLGTLAIITTEVIFGLTVLFGKIILNTGYPVFAMLAWRICLAVFFMALMFALGFFKGSLKGKNLIKLIPIGLCEPCAYFIFETIGLDMTSAAETGTIIALVPVVVLVASRIFLKERHTPLQIAGVFLSVAGVIVVVFAGITGDFHFNFSAVGYLCLFLAVIAVAGYNITVKLASDEFTGLEITFGTNLMGAILFIIIVGIQGLVEGNLGMIVTMPFTEPKIIGSLLFLSIGSSIIAFTLFNYAIKHLGPTRTSSFSGIVSVTSILSGILLLGDVLSLGQAIGAAMIILGAYAANKFIYKETVEYDSADVNQGSDQNKTLSKE